jgi:Domain of unknown function (DUF5668)
MEPSDRGRAKKRLIWGVFLIVLGSAFLLDHLHIVELPSLGSLWPAVFLVITVSHITEGQLGAALTSLLLGFWFFACEFGWYGFRYGNSWPLILIAIGAGIVVRALRGERRHRMWGGRET